MPRTFVSMTLADLAEILIEESIAKAAPGIRDEHVDWRVLAAAATSLSTPSVVARSALTAWTFPAPCSCLSSLAASSMAASSAAIRRS